MRWGTGYEREPEFRKVFRNSKNTVWWTAAAFALAAAFAATFTIQNVSAIERWSFRIAFGAGLYFCYRAAMASVIAGSHGLRVRSLTKTILLRWEDIQRFEFRRRSFFGLTGIAILKDGSDTWLPTIHESTLPGTQVTAEDQLDRLTALLLKNCEKTGEQDP